MKYKKIIGREEPQSKVELLTPEQKIAMDIIDSFPAETDMQHLYKEVHLRANGSYKQWRIKAEINVLLQRRKGIESTYLDFLDEDFEIENLRDLADIMKSTKKQATRLSKDKRRIIRLKDR